MIANSELCKKSQPGSQNQLSFSNPAAQLTLIFLFIYVFVQVFILLLGNFHVYLNDFWIFRLTARTSDWSDPGSFFDGFFPYLYPAIVKIIPDSSLLVVAGLLSVVAGAIALWLVFMTGSRITNAWWGLVPLWMVAFHPEFFTYVTNPGTDILALLPLALMILILTSISTDNLSGPKLSWYLFSAGLLVGVAATIRYHAAIFIVIPLVFVLLRPSGKIRGILFVLVGAGIAYLPQFVVNISAGKGLFETFQGFNVYRQAVGVDWYTTSSLAADQYSSILTVIVNHPSEFFIGFASNLASFVFPLFVIAMGTWLSFGTRHFALLVSFLVGTFVYSLFVSMAFSGRAFILILPVWGIASAVVFSRVHGWLKRIGDQPWLAPKPVGFVVAVGLLFGTFGWIASDIQVGFGRVDLERSRVNYSAVLENTVNSGDMDAVFSNDFNFYSTEIDGFVPRYNGGLVQIGTSPRPLWPEIDTTSVDSFLCSAFREGIQYVVWNPANSSGVDPTLAQTLTGEIANPNFVFAGSEGLRVISLVYDSDPCNT